MTIRVTLDRVLLERRMSLTELSERVGVTLANLSILKTGKAKAIRFSTLEALCRELKCQPGDLLVFDTEGKSLEFSSHGRVIAVPGVHKGLLLRDAAANSFLAPNPNATPADAFALDRDPDVVAARNELVGVMSQMAAFKAAIKNADAATGNVTSTSCV